MKKYNLLVVAHPDDETIFFGGVLQVYRRRPWKIICVTDGNADGDHNRREQDFKKACSELKVKDFAMWDFPDRYTQRLDLSRLTERLKVETPSEVFTHGPLGEYGHPHHQDVCLAVHRAFKPNLPVWSVAYNGFAEKTFRMPRKAYEKKCRILSEIYFSQTHNFARFLPAHMFEGFNQLNLNEIEALYRFFANHQAVTEKDLKVYSWFAPYLESMREQISQRPF